MYRVVNIPHAKNRRAVLTPSVDGQTAYVKSVDPEMAEPYNSAGVCDMFIGDHMFEADKRDSLRMMVAQALITAIEQARDIGYRQAQSDIRDALGVSRS